MLDTDARERAETLFDRTQKREQAIGDALKEAAARHEAIVANMQRLRALRLSRNAQPSSDKAEQKLACCQTFVDAGAQTALPNHRCCARRH